MFESTGDPLIDKWEQELASGITPNLEEGLPAHEREKLRKEREHAKVARGLSAEVGNMSKRLEGAVKDDPMYKTKTVVRGSKEEQELLRSKSIGYGYADFDMSKLLGK